MPCSLGMFSELENGAQSTIVGDVSSVAVLIGWPRVSICRSKMQGIALIQGGKQLIALRNPITAEGL